MARTVQCKKLGKEAPGLDKPPFDGELGREIYDNVSQEAWELWSDQMMVRVINEYRLNLADSEHYNVFLDEMRAFFNLSAGDKPAD
jgi:Fe-S cluster biosynthesis and repair protein YggX